MPSTTTRQRPSCTLVAARSGRVLIQRTASGPVYPVYQEAYTHVHGSLMADLWLGLRATVGVDNLLDDVPAAALAVLGRRWYGGLSWGGGW